MRFVNSFLSSFFLQICVKDFDSITGSRPISVRVTIQGKYNVIIISPRDC